MRKFLTDHWKQMFFGVVGLAFLATSFALLWKNNVAGASATFAMAFFAFIYSDISRFKRFKGFGFEAELWEEKQQEAAELIDRLKAVVTVYTREIILGKVMQGRWGDGAKWKDYWKLYEELVQKHSEIGQKIDFTDLKRTLDGIFIFDIISNHYAPLVRAVEEGRAQARNQITKEVGNPIQDMDKYQLRLTDLEGIPAKPGDIFVASQEGNAAEIVLNWATTSKRKLASTFGVDIDLDEEVMGKLENLSKLYQSGPLVVTDELLELTKFR